MKLWNTYHTPTTIDEALALLRRCGGKARVIAGGTDLLVDMRAEAQPAHESLVDITRIPELGRITADETYVYIGAGVTHTRIVQSPLIVQHATCLVESCGVIGGPQVRNVATLGGNVAHALPAGDGTVSLVALDAEAEIIQNDERRWLPITEMFLGPGQSLINPAHDLLLGFRFPRLASRAATSFRRVMRPQGVALPVLGCAVWVRLDAGLSAFEAARVCIAPAGPTPRRIREVEAALIGKPADETTLEAAAQTAGETLSLRTSKYRATAAYRQEMAAVLLRHTLTRAIDRARTGTAVPEGI